MATARSTHSVRFDCATRALVVDHLRIDHPDVLREATHWAAGRRVSVSADDTALAAADLSAFVDRAVILGSTALSAVGQSQDARAFEDLLKDVTQKTAEAATRAAELTDRASAQASQAVAKATKDASRAITEADERTRREVATAVRTATTELVTTMRSLVGGEHPELLERLAPLLDTVGAKLDRKVTASTAVLLDKVTRQFDPSDPTSPMAKQVATLTANQQGMVTQIEKNHAAIVAKVEEFTTAIQVRDATAAVTKLSPRKGDSLERQIHALMVEIAAGTGDEYTETGTLTGRVARSKKGDGLLHIDGGAARLAVEITDSARRSWSEYLDEVERNRNAGAVLGVVRTIEQNAGHAVRVLGNRRIIVAIDPEQDGPDLLRAVVLVLRTAALLAASRSGSAEIATAQEQITQARRHLERINVVKREASVIKKSAEKIDAECEVIGSAITRALAGASDALSGASAAIPSAA